MGIAIRHATLFINLPSIGKPIKKPLIPNIAKLYLRYPITEERLVDRSDYTLRSI